MDAKEVTKRIRSLPKDGTTNFDYSGMAYFDHKLYATSNVGLLVFAGGKFEFGLRWRSRYNVVSGPWIDSADHLLWLSDDDDGDLLNFDGQQWHRVPMPTPAKGYY